MSTTRRSPISSLRTFARDRRGEMDEAAIVFPVMLLLAIGLVNMALLGVAAVNAGNAANYGARMGAVAQANPAGNAYASASQDVQAAHRFSCPFSAAGSWASFSAHHSKAVCCCCHCSWQSGLPIAGCALLAFPSVAKNSLIIASSPSRKAARISASLGKPIGSMPIFCSAFMFLTMLKSVQFRLYMPEQLPPKNK